MAREHHVIELTWDDETGGLNAVHGTVDGNLVTGPSVQNVLRKIAELVSPLSPPPLPQRAGRVAYRCSFCGKSCEQVRQLVKGPGGVYACNECIDAMHDSLMKDAPIT